MDPLSLSPSFFFLGCIFSGAPPYSIGGTVAEGLSQEELFLWLPIKDIIGDDPKSGLMFDIRATHKHPSASTTAPSLTTSYLRVATFLKSQTNIDHIKVLNANPDMLRTFANTSIVVTVTVGSGNIPSLSSSIFECE